MTSACADNSLGQSIGLSISTICPHFKELQLWKPRCEVSDTVNKYTVGQKHSDAMHIDDTQCTHSD